MCEYKCIGIRICEHMTRWDGRGNERKYDEGTD